MTYYFMLENGYLNQNGGVELGLSTPKNMTSALLNFMNFWAKKIDGKINLVVPYEADYCSLIESRFFTYAEFELLFDKNIKEEEYILHRAYEFYMLASAHDKTKLLKGIKQDFKGYVDLLAKSMSSCKSFFATPLRMEIPMSGLQNHAHIVGKSGQGKSNLLKLLVFRLLEKSELSSIVLIDPHGDLSTEIRDLKLVYEKRKRLVYIDPFYEENFLPVINPFESNYKSLEELDRYSQELSKIIVSLLQEGSVLTTQMEAALRPAISTLLNTPNTTFEDLQILLATEESQRRTELIESGLNNPLKSHQRMFRFIWGSQQIPHSYRMTLTSIFTKIQSLLNTDVFYQLTCGNKGKSSISLNSFTNQNKLIICNLSKGRLGSEASEAYGKLLLAMLQSNALQRSSVSKEDRKQVYIIVDEFQNYTTDSINVLLDEARKYKFSLVLSHQSIGQIESPKIQDAVLGNMGVRIIGRSNKKTLRAMSDEMDLKLEDFGDLEPFEFFVEAQNNEYNSINPRPYRLKPSTFLLNKDTEFYQNKTEMEKLKVEQIQLYYCVKENDKHSVGNEDLIRSKNSKAMKNTNKTPSGKVGTGQKPKYPI